MTEGEKIPFQMLQDQIAALRMAISWLMAEICPDEAREWLAIQQAEFSTSTQLEEMNMELKELAADLDRAIDLTVRAK